MENCPVSENPVNGQKPDEILDDPDAVSLYRSVMSFLGEDSPDSDYLGSKKIKNLAQETFARWSENTAFGGESIWGYRFFYTEAADSSADLSNRANFQAQVSNQEQRMETVSHSESFEDLLQRLENLSPWESVADSSNLQNLEDQVSDPEQNMERVGLLQSYADLLDLQNFEDQVSNREQRQENLSHLESYPVFCRGSTFVLNDLYKQMPIYCDETSDEPTYICQENQGFEEGHYEPIETKPLKYERYYLSMMTDKENSSAFKDIVKWCCDLQLQSIAEELLSWKQDFINSAFCKEGATSIVLVIKRLKKPSVAFRLTDVLSTRFLAMMTHYQARTVIHSCFIHLGDQPNKILYEKAIHHFLEMATDKVGCRSLNETINTIAGKQRTRLLNCIADVSAYLSNDPYGNYVVQHVLALSNREVSSRVVLKLRGQFVNLSSKSGGSQVVEKCIESSYLGTITVVQELLCNKTAPYQLAKNEFGNYVIQKALRKTMEYHLHDLHDSLVGSLLLYREELHGSKGGKKVLHLLKGGGGYDWRRLGWMYT